MLRRFIDSIVFPRTSLTVWDKEWQINFANGISYIYERPEADTVIIFSHGSGGNLTGRTRIRDLFKDSKVGLIMYDYYGYGASNSVQEINQKVFTDSIIEISRIVRNKKIILMGASLGSYPSCWLASQKLDNLLGLILCVPFDNIPWPLGYYYEPYDNYSLAKSIKIPTLIIKAEYDEIISSNAAERLYDVLNNVILFTVEESHKTYLNNVAKQHILDFVRDISK